MSQSLTEIPGMSGEVLQLFEAAGFSQTPDLLSCPEEEVLTRLNEVNNQQGMVGRMPSEAAIKAWLAAARVLESIANRDEKVPLTAETMRKVRESAIMHARPVPGRELVDAGIKVDSVPIADFVGEARHQSVEESHRERGDGRENRRRSARKLRPAEVSEAQPKPQVDAPEDGADSDGKPASLPEAQGSTRVYNLKAREEVSPEVPLDEAAPDFAPVGEGQAEDEEMPRQSVHDPGEGGGQFNFRGIDEVSMAKKGLERRNSGMTHKHPRRVVASALSTIVAVLGSGLCGFSVILLGGYYMAAEKTFPVWMIVLLAVTVLFGAQFFFFGVNARCRLCGQRLFVTKACRKHEKAPRSFLGSGFATALQVLGKSSWRCMFCGTKQKLKKED